MKPFNVYLNGKLIDTVYFVADTTVEYVRQSLIKFDGFDHQIKVRAAKK